MTRGHKTLLRFLKKSELTPSQLAQLAGISQMQISHLIQGRRRASLEVAVALEQATLGAVTARSWTETARAR